LKAVVTSVVSTLWLLMTPAVAVTEPLPDEQILADAISAFKEGISARGSPTESALFGKSAALFEELRRRGASNARLLCNEGNAYLLAGDLPQAILAYHRGLRLAPNDSSLRANLAYARDQVGYSSTGRFGRPPVEAWPPWLPRLTPGVCWVLAVVFYSLSCLAMTRWCLTHRAWLRSASAVTLMLALLLVAGFVIEARKARQAADHPLVVIAADAVMMRKGNGQGYPPRYETPLNRGTEARLRFLRGDWLQIELAGGEIGWVPRAGVLLDVSAET
jgi:tetratricopeptide (TPR) repeat protein